MVTYAGGRNERFQSDLKSITGAYKEVMRVMKFADVMINVPNLKNTGKLTQDTGLILDRKSSMVHKAQNFWPIGEAT